MRKKSDSKLSKKSMELGIAGLNESYELLAGMDFPTEFKKLLIMDCFNNEFSRQEFLDYLASGRVKAEGRRFSDPAPAARNKIAEIRRLMDAGDYHGAISTVKKELQANPQDRQLQLLEVISSFKGRNPCTLHSKEIPRIIDILFSISLDDEYGHIAEVILNIAIISCERFNGASFPRRDIGLISHDGIEREHLELLKHINVPGQIKEKALASASNAHGHKITEGE